MLPNILQVCKKTYLFIHNIGEKKYTTVKQSYLKNGLDPIVHLNTNTLPHHAFTTQELQQITRFISNYAESNAILLPGRIPGYKRCDLQLLPTQCTKRSIWDSYVKACATLTFRMASYRSFCRIWQRYKPHVVITTPKSDLCWTCQRNSNAITMSANTSEVEKMEVHTFEIYTDIQNNNWTTYFNRY